MNSSPRWLYTRRWAGTEPPPSPGGNLVSAGYSVSVIDGEYELLLTDMPKASESSGVLVNLDGEIVGIIQNAAGLLAALIGLVEPVHIVAGRRDRNPAFLSE